MVPEEFELCSVHVRKYVSMSVCMYVWVIIFLYVALGHGSAASVGMVSKYIPLRSKTIKLIGEVQYIM